MNISISFRHLEATDSIKAYATEKVGKLQRFLRQPMTARVTLSLEKHEQVAEIRVSSGSEHHEAKEATTDMYTAIDRVIDKLERQIGGSKGLAVSRRRDETARAAEAVEAE
jgi:putative sigma-54 modulation protein